MPEQIEVIGAQPYEKVRRDCHAFKDGDTSAIARYARQIIKLNPEAFSPDKVNVLIPVPGHNGYARETRVFAEFLVAELTRRHIPAQKAEMIVSRPHESLYNLKKKGKDIRRFDLGMEFKDDTWKKIFNFLKDEAKDTATVFLVDNVVDTGHTVREIFKLTGPLPVIAVGDSGIHRQPKNN